MIQLKVNTNHMLPKNCYNRVAYEKSQVYIHHTNGGENPIHTIQYWKNYKNKSGKKIRIGTAFVIAGKPRNEKQSQIFHDGEIFQAFASKYYAAHLGVKKKQLVGFKTSQLSMHRYSVGIEICNAGALVWKNGGFYASSTKRYYEKEQVVTYKYPYRGYYHYHKYTDAQIESLRKTLIYLSATYSIDISYKGRELFAYQPNVKHSPTYEAFSLVNGKPKNGLYTHTTIRGDKLDCHPQKELIKVLESL